MMKNLLDLKNVIVCAIALAGFYANSQCNIINQPASPNTTNNSGTYDYVQSFTAPCSGDMLYFELTATEAGTLPGATLYVYNGNVPTGTAIYTQAYPNIVSSGAGSPLTISITNPLPLVSGNQYSFRFEATNQNFHFTTGSAYGGGHIWQNGSPLTSTDFYFDIGIVNACSPTSIVPDVATLGAVSDQCSVALINIPTATNSCGTVVSGVSSVPLPISTQGTTQITWTFDDGEGNITTQTQDVVIADVTAPVADSISLPDLLNQCEATSLVAPTATDNCGGTIIGATTTTTPISSLGTSVITWSFDDGNGNVSTQTQNVVNPSIDNTVNVTGSIIQANQTAATYQWVDCDSSFIALVGEINQSYTATVTGNYAVEITIDGCVDTSACQLIDFTGIEDLSLDGKELVKIVDFLGRETEFKKNTPLIFIYSDGTMKRVMEVEL